MCSCMGEDEGVEREEVVCYFALYPLTIAAD